MYAFYLNQNFISYPGRRISYINLKVVSNQSFPPSHALMYYKSNKIILLFEAFIKISQHFNF